MPPIGRVRLSVCFLSFHWTSWPFILCVRVTAVALRRLTDQGHRSEVKAKIGLSMQICVCYMSIVCSVLSVVVVGFQLFTVTLLMFSGSGRFRGRSDIEPRRRAVFSSVICERFCASLLCSVMTWDHLLYHAQCKCKCRFVERIKARNLCTAAAPLMRHVSQLRRKHASLYAVLKLSIFKTMNACNGVVDRAFQFAIRIDSIRFIMRID